uniref:Putative secreted protein n=1 Tax=Amblyomma americanum TaxID=6943 RepID=A0A0C9SF45_AMBAM
MASIQLLCLCVFSVLFIICVVVANIFSQNRIYTFKFIIPHLRTVCSHITKFSQLRNHLFVQVRHRVQVLCHGDGQFLQLFMGTWQVHLRTVPGCPLHRILRGPSRRPPPAPRYLRQLTGDSHQRRKGASWVPSLHPGSDGLGSRCPHTASA